MKRREVHLQELLGRPVLDRHGVRVGHLQEVRVTNPRTRHVVTEYLVGPGGWLERMHMRLRRTRARGYRIGWDQLDISRPERLVLTCDRAALRPIDGEDRDGGEA